MYIWCSVTRGKRGDETVEEYVVLSSLVQRMELKNVQILYYWEANKLIEVTLVDGKKSMRKADADKLVEIWTTSCTPKKAAELIGISERGGSITNLINKGLLETVNPFGKESKFHRRILLSSIERAVEYVAGSEERIRAILERGRTSPNRPKFVPGSGHKWDSVTAKKAAIASKLKRRLTKHSLVLYIPTTREERDVVGDKKLATEESGAKFIGVPISRLRNLGIRGEHIGEMFLPFVHSLEVYKSKQKNGKKKP